MRQETYMMLKPDAFESGHAKAVLADLEAAGLHVEKSCKVQVDMDVMKILMEHYREVIDTMSKDFNFPGKLFNSFYYDGPHYIMPLKIIFDGEEDIISYSRTLVGKTNPQAADPATIRGKYSDDNYELATLEVRLVSNVIHASDSKGSAARELQIWSQYL